MLRKSKIQMKIESKLSSVQARSEEKLFSYTKIGRQTKKEVEAMKLLEQTMLTEYSASVTALRSSRRVLQKKLRH